MEMIFFNSVISLGIFFQQIAGSDDITDDEPIEDPPGV